jgi:SAM-dependent methyltransferase
VTASDVSAPPLTGDGDDGDARWGEVADAATAAHRPRVPHPTDLYGRALMSRLAGRTNQNWRVRHSDGTVRCLSAALDLWLGPCDDADRSVLARCAGSTLDVGCGPGRLVSALRGTGRAVLGIDVNEVAVRLTRNRGGTAVRADVFGPVPGERRWDTVVLLDGNLGIGGDPVRLFARCARLLAPGGRLLVEGAAPGKASGIGRRRLENDAEFGPWFPWAGLTVGGIAAAATATALRVDETWSEGSRWFTALSR